MLRSARAPPRRPTPSPEWARRAVGTGLTLTMAHASRATVGAITPAGTTTIQVADASGVSAGDTLYIDSLATSSLPYRPQRAA
jgi:hypothetical protein